MGKREKNRLYMLEYSKTKATQKNVLKERR